MDSPSPWSAQQLAEFLAAVSDFSDEQSALTGGLELITEAVEAEVGAIVRADEVVAVRGFPVDQAPSELLLAAAAGARASIDLAGVGACPVLVVPMELEEGLGQLLVARSGSGFLREESSLLRGMARVLSLTCRGLRVVVRLRRRQAHLERLAAIQRSISMRVPVEQIFDAITAGVSELFGGDFVTLHFRDSIDAPTLTPASTYGVPAPLVETLARRMIGSGALGRAVAENDLVVIENYQEWPHATNAAWEAGVQAAIAAPVHDHGETVGSLMSASMRAGRRYSSEDRELLLSFAEVTSLAVTDAKTVDALQLAMNDALHRALHDPLTGLANRTRLIDRLDHALSIRHQTGHQVAVIYVDLDDFKTINDRFGHSMGDRVLVAVAEQLVATAREGDTVARIGGDEFAVLLESVEVGDAERIAEHILRRIRSRHEFAAAGIVTNASVGVALSGPETSLSEEVLRNADVAMYQAKGAGKARSVTFEPEMYERLLERIELEADLRTALESDGVEVHFQPIVSLEGEEVVGAEALARWNHPTRGYVEPATFIPLAEAIGLIVPLGRQILAKACRQFASWQERLPGAPALTLSVNVSARQIQRSDFVRDVSAALDGSGFNARSLILEITESALMHNSEETLVRLHELRSLGVRLAIDDFGTGFSSLSYLRQFPVDFLKIDQSFVGALCSGEPTIRRLTEAILVLGDSLRLECVAEGIEHHDELEALRDLGCQWGQGTYFAAPLPAEQFMEFLESHRLESMVRAAHRPAQ